MIVPPFFQQTKEMGLTPKTKALMEAAKKKEEDFALWFAIVPAGRESIKEWRPK